MQTGFAESPDELQELAVQIACTGLLAGAPRRHRDGCMRLRLRVPCPMTRSTHFVPPPTLTTGSMHDTPQKSHESDRARASTGTERRRTPARPGAGRVSSTLFVAAAAGCARSERGAPHEPHVTNVPACAADGHARSVLRLSGVFAWREVLHDTYQRLSLAHPPVRRCIRHNRSSSARMPSVTSRSRYV